MNTLVLFALCCSLLFSVCFCARFAARISPTQTSLSRADRYLPSPHGGLLHESCVYRVRSGSRVEYNHESGGFRVTTKSPESDSADATVTQLIPSCGLRRRPNALSKFTSRKSAGNSTASFTGGWQTYTKQNLGDSVSAFTGAWNVPDVPQTYKSQTIFLFIGMQNIDWVPPDAGPKGKFDIIQPVLQYGPSACGGGQYWALSSWYVPLGGLFDEAVCSDLVQVQPGDRILGNMTRTGPTSFYIDTFSSALNKHTELTATYPRLASQPWLYVTHESYADYDALTCDMFPLRPALFDSLAVVPASTATSSAPFAWNWTAIVKDPYCNSSVLVSDSGRSVTLGFQNHP